jgi:hypothetical protein
VAVLETKKTNLDNEQLKRNCGMAQKRISESALKNVLETAVEVLQDAEDADDGMVTLSNGVYMRLRTAVKEATGVAHGIAVSDESDVDDEEDDEDEEEHDDEDDG